METNKIIAEWLGWKPNDSRGEEWWDGKELHLESEINFTTSDSAAITLLPELNVRAQEAYYLISRFNGEVYVWACVPWHMVVLDEVTEIPNENFKPSISEAICAAICSLIEKEKQDE